MAKAEGQERRLLIGQDASNLAFQIGQAVQKNLMNRALRCTAARNADIVSAADVEAVAVELGLTKYLGPTGGKANGEESRAEPDAIRTER